MRHIVSIKDNIKRLQSEDCNYTFDLETGRHAVWGKTYEDDPQFSPFGPFIADIEISTKCSGIDGKLCSYCYKSNTPVGTNMSLETFKKVITQLNTNQQLTQVAFGLGSRGNENPDLWAMCAYLRENHIIPNGTIAQLDDETADLIAGTFGGCAVSYHSDFDVLADTVKRLVDAKSKPGMTLRQVNVHFMLAQETADDCLKLFDLIKSDSRFNGLNAIVLLGLKKCGRAEKGGFNRVDDATFRHIMMRAFGEGIGIGFDSCSANRVLQHVREIAAERKVGRKDVKAIDNWQRMIETLAEPCESLLFSSYVNVDGNFYSCSFCENKEEPVNVLECKSFLNEIWNGPIGKARRDRLIANGRSCPHYEV
jgi:hypothetical protein